MAYAKEIGAPYELVVETKQLGRLPVVNFAAGGIATPADAALMMQLGVDGVFVGSGIFKSGDPARRAKAIVEATTHFREPEIIAEVSKNLGEPMVGRQSLVHSRRRTDRTARLVMSEDITFRLAMVRRCPIIVHHRRAMFTDMGHTDTASLDAMDATFTPYVRRSDLRMALIAAGWQ